VESAKVERASSAALRGAGAAGVSGAAARPRTLMPPAGSRCQHHGRRLLLVIMCCDRLTRV